MIDISNLPATRYQGSKKRVAPVLSEVFKSLEFNTALDLFSGSGIVSLLLRLHGKTVTSNDFLQYSALCARTFLNMSTDELDVDMAEEDLTYLLAHAPIEDDAYVSNSFQHIYFTDNENKQIDRFLQNIDKLKVSEMQKNVYRYAFGQALLKKRPYNLFHRKNLEMRLKNVERSFGNKKTWETPIIEHMMKTINELGKVNLTNLEYKPHTSLSHCAEDLHLFPKDVDLVYLDPPYLPPNGGKAIDYSDFYHFLEGIVDYQLYKKFDTKFPHRPIARKKSAWLTKADTLEELSRIAEYFNRSIIVLNYRDDSQMTPKEAMEALSCAGHHVKVASAAEYKYALSPRTGIHENFIVAKPKTC